MNCSIENCDRQGEHMLLDDSGRWGLYCPQCCDAYYAGNNNGLVETLTVEEFLAAEIVLCGTEPLFPEKP